MLISEQNAQNHKHERKKQHSDQIVMCFKKCVCFNRLGFKYFKSRYQMLTCIKTRTKLHRLICIIRQMLYIQFYSNSISACLYKCQPKCVMFIQLEKMNLCYNMKVLLKVQFQLSCFNLSSILIFTPSTKAFVYDVCLHI